MCVMCVGGVGENSFPRWGDKSAYFYNKRATRRVRKCKRPWRQSHEIPRKAPGAFTLPRAVSSPVVYSSSISRCYLPGTIQGSLENEPGFHTLTERRPCIQASRQIHTQVDMRARHAGWNTYNTQYNTTPRPSQDLTRDMRCIPGGACTLPS